MERATQDGQQLLVSNQAVVRRERRVEDLTDTLANISGSMNKIADMGQALSDKMLDNLAEKDVNAVALGIQRLNDEAELDESITKDQLIAKTNEIYAEHQRDISGFRYDDRFTKLVEPAMAEQFQSWDKRQKKIDRKVSLQADADKIESFGINADKPMYNSVHESMVKLGCVTSAEASLDLTKRAVTAQDTDFSKDGEFYQDMYNEEGRDALFEYMYGATLGMEHMEEGGYNYNLLQNAFDKYEKAIVKANGDGSEPSFDYVAYEVKATNANRQALTGKLSNEQMAVIAEELHKISTDENFRKNLTDSEKKNIYKMNLKLNNAMIATNQLTNAMIDADMTDAESFALFSSNQFIGANGNMIDVGKDFAKNVAGRLQESIDETLTNPNAKPEDVAKSMAMSYKINNRTGVKSKTVLKAEKIASGDVQATTIADIQLAIAASNQGKEGTSNADRTVLRTTKELEGQLEQWKINGVEPKLSVLNTIIRANSISSQSYFTGTGRTKTFTEATDEVAENYYNTTFSPSTLRNIAYGISVSPQYPDTKDGMKQYIKDNYAVVRTGEFGGVGNTLAAVNPLYDMDTMQINLKRSDGTVLGQAEQEDGLEAMNDILNRKHPNSEVEYTMNNLQFDSVFKTGDDGVKEPAWRVYLKQDGKLIPIDTFTGTDLAKFKAENENWKANNKGQVFANSAEKVVNTVPMGRVMTKGFEIINSTATDSAVYFRSIFK